MPNRCPFANSVCVCDQLAWKHAAVMCTVMTRSMAWYGKFCSAELHSPWFSGKSLLLQAAPACFVVQVCITAEQKLGQSMSVVTASINSNALFLVCCAAGNPIMRTPRSSSRRFPADSYNGRRGPIPIYHRIDTLPQSADTLDLRDETILTPGADEVGLVSLCKSWQYCKIRLGLFA